MFEECVPPILVARLICRSGFGGAVGCAEAADSNDIQYIMFMGDFFMCNDSDVYGGRIWLKRFVSVWSDMWKSRERESAMIFSVPLMCCEYMVFLFMTSVQPIQQATALCDSDFTGSKDALRIQPSVLKLSVNANICDPCSNFRMAV